MYDVPSLIDDTAVQVLKRLGVMVVNHDHYTISPRRGSVLLQGKQPVGSDQVSFFYGRKASVAPKW